MPERCLHNWQPAILPGVQQRECTFGLRRVVEARVKGVGGLSQELKPLLSVCGGEPREAK